MVVAALTFQLRGDVPILSPTCRDGCYWRPETASVDLVVNAPARSPGPRRLQDSHRRAAIGSDPLQLAVCPEPDPITIGREEGTYRTLGARQGSCNSSIERPQEETRISIVAAGAEADALREELIEQLTNARDPETGEAIVTEIYRREEIYNGPYLEIAPDIVYLTGSERYAASGLPRQWRQPSPLSEMTGYFGVHTMDGIFIAAGPGVRPASGVNDATICDIAPTVLYATGHSVPEHMTGRVLESIFSRDYLVENPISQEAITLERKAVVGHGEQEEEDMLNKLRGLGYVD